MGQVKFGPVGSAAVRDVLERTQPLLGLHGHIHESSGIRRIGPDDRDQPRQRLLDRRAERSPRHARAGQGRGPPARPRMTSPGDRRNPRDERGHGGDGADDPAWRVVALDVGTSGARAAAFDLDGQRRLEVRRSYPTTSPRPGWAEQDPARWRSAGLAALAELVTRVGRGARPRDRPHRRSARRSSSSTQRTARSGRA